MKIRIEDNYDDVIGKAQKGLGMSKEELALQSSLSEAEIDAALSGLPDKASISKIAAALGLSANALYLLARGKAEPKAEACKGLTQFNTPYPVPGYEEMTVNSYVVHDPLSKKALIFDSGADASPMIEHIDSLGLEPVAIFLTHTHEDHIDDMAALQQKYPQVPVYVSTREKFEGAEQIDEGYSLTAAQLVVRTYLTDGHSPGGLTFYIEGLSRPVAIVGDSIFACSMGGAPKAYEIALRNNREKIMTMPEQTILCPGHGPLTTVAEEKTNNPFFAD